MLAAGCVLSYQVTMLNHTFWKNAAWLCQIPRRSTFSVEVCHIKQFCALNNNDTSPDDFDSLAVGAGKEENSDGSSESELAYFANAEAPQESSQVPYKIPLKQTLAYTNKVLFGPLLETAAERKRKHKMAKAETEITQKTKKKKKPKKSKPAMSTHSLLLNSENAHLLGIFPGDDSKYNDKFCYHKVMIEHEHETGNFSDSRGAKPRSKVLLFKKSGKQSVKSENYVLNDFPMIQKIHVTSWNKEKELGAASSSDGNTADDSEQINGDDNLSQSSTAENKSNGSTYLAYSTSDIKTGNDQETENTRGNCSLLSVDNAKFTSVPNIIDIEMMEKFPLEKTESQSILSKTAMNTDENILTIGMFDGGYQKLPSVSKILEATMPEDQKRILERWKAKMIRELGEEGFQEYKKGLFEKGKLLHGCIHSELTGISPSVENMPTVQGSWTSISHVLPNISNVSVLESRLIHPYLNYQGAVDCIASYKGMPVIIDWKTSTKPKLTLKSMFDNPLQVVAYLGALNYDNNYQLPHQVQSAMLVVAYDTGLPAHVHIIDKEKCQAYWKVWCTRLIQFWRQLEVKESV